MGGIVGVWNRNGRPVDASVLGRMRQRLTHRPGVQWMAIPAAFAAPAISFDGRLDNRDQLIDTLARHAPPADDAPDAALALAAYQVFGDDVAARLEGDFAFAVFDPARQALLLARDAIGLRPLHYYADAGVCLWASEIKAITAHPDVRTAPNDEVVADYMFNLLAAEDRRGETFFRDIFSVQPAHVVRISSGAVVASRYWDFDTTRRMTVRSAADAEDGFREHFTRAVRRRVRSSGPVAVSVSGGVDSAAILGVAGSLRRREGGQPLFGISYVVADGRPADEKRYLADIERACGVPITQWPDQQGGVAEHGSMGVWHVEGPLLESRWSGTMAYYAAIRDRGAATLLTGHWGDQVLVDVGFFVDLLRAGRWPEAWRCLATYRQWRDDGAGDAGRAVAAALLKDSVPRPALEAARRLRDRRRTPSDLAAWYTPWFLQSAALARRRRPAEVRSGTVHARRLYRTIRSRYYGLAMEWQNKLAAMFGLDVAFPFLDRDLVSFLMAVPGEAITPGGVPKGILRRALSDVLPASIAERRTKADFSGDVNAAAAGDYDKLVSRLRAGSAAVSYGYAVADAPGDIERFRPSRDAGTCTLSWALTDRLSLDLWLDAFFGHSTEVSRHA
jgi:asparagine synthase (glutamine-hydrolysing)